MIKLIIDIGNSYTKTGFFDKSNIIDDDCIENNDESKIINIVKKHQIKQTIISSVNKNQENIIKKIIYPYAGKITVFNHQTKLPFVNCYETPETLGNDRLAAVAGAQLLFPDKNLLVIDAGTAITYDLMIDNKFLGGNITPGLKMRLKALNYFTGSLPLVEIQEKNELPGKTTVSAISAGVLNGMIFEIEGFRDYYEKKIGKIITIISGGDLKYFVDFLKKPIFANSNLILIGLNRILEYNEN